jgi:hypothetical protein
MKFLRLVKRCFIEQKPHDLSSIECLPNEMIQHIAILLPLSSAAALTLCSHNFYSALGTDYWEKLPRTQQQRD